MRYFILRKITVINLSFIFEIHVLKQHSSDLLKKCIKITALQMRREPLLKVNVIKATTLKLNRLGVS